MADNARYKWFILVLVGLTATLVMAMPGMAISVLFSEISEDLGLNVLQVGAVWGIGSLAGMFTGLLGGVIGDRFGTRRTLAVGCLSMGIAGALRGFSSDFASLMAAMLLTGLVGAAIPMNLHKACGIWFSEKSLGLANGVVSAGMALGSMSGSLVSATILSPWLGSWRGVLFFYGGIAVVMSIPWVLSKPAPGDGRPPQRGQELASIRRSLAHIVRLKDVWLLGFVLFAVSGCVQGLLGYLPLYLREIGWQPVRADAALASFHAISLAFVFPLAHLSDRLKSRKRLLLLAGFMIAAGVGLLTVVDGLAVWAAVLCAGIVRDGFMAILVTSVTEVKGVGPLYAGTALGLTYTLSQLGNLVAPPLGNSLASYQPSAPFTLWAGMALLGLLILLNFKDRRGGSDDETAAADGDIDTP